MTQLTLNAELQQNIYEPTEKNNSVKYHIGDLTYKKSKLINIEKQYHITDESNNLVDKEILNVVYNLTFLEENGPVNYTTSYSPKEVGQYYFYVTNNQNNIETIFIEPKNIKNAVKNHIKQKIKYETEYSTKFLPFPFMFGAMHLIMGITVYFGSNVDFNNTKEALFFTGNLVYSISLLLGGFGLSLYFKNEGIKDRLSAFNTLGL